MTQPSPFSDTRPRTSDDIDFAHIFAVIRRHFLVLLLAALAMGAVTYGVFSRQTPTYLAATSILASGSDSGNAALSSASVAAAPLPQGAVEQIVHSRQTVQRLEQLINASSLPAAAKARISRALGNELRSGQFRTLSVKSSLDTQQRGVYELQATADTASAARLLASLATQALLEWDIQRARQNIERARQNLQAQVSNLSARLAATAPGSLERQSLIAARGQLTLSLSQATVLEAGAVGTLSLLSEASTPLYPVAPRPLRNALLFAVMTFVVLALLALLRDASRRRIQSTADVLGLAPAIGELPWLPRFKQLDVFEAVAGGALYEATGFIRMNLNTTSPQALGMFAVSSARPGEGKSLTVAAIAASYASIGQRVLIIDLDLHRPAQHQYWSLSGSSWAALEGGHELPGQHQTTVMQAIEEPEQASAAVISPGVHLLPGAEAGRRAASLLATPALPALLRRWASGYDLVLIDTPPVLSVVDALLIASFTDGLLLVAESDRASVAEARDVLERARASRIPLLGFVINKVKRPQKSYTSKASPELPLNFNFQESEQGTP